MKSMNTRSDQKESTRRALVAAARKAFGANGITATPVSEVARAAGRSHGSVFVHFGSQEGLIVAVVEDFGLGLARRLHDLVQAGAGLATVLSAHLQGIGEDEAFYTRLVREESLLPAEARLGWVACQSAVSFHLMPALEAGVAAGVVKPLAPGFLFNAWVGLVHHYLTHGDLFAPGGSVVGQRGPELVAGFIDMVAAGDKGERLS